MSSKRNHGHVFVKTASGLVIPFKPPALDYVAATTREAERVPAYLLTVPGQAYAGHIVRADDGEPELWLEPVDSIGADPLRWLGPVSIALEHFANADKANAAMHMAPVKFSPITFALAELVTLAGSDFPAAAEVMAHRGRYELDPGR